MVATSISIQATSTAGVQSVTEEAPLVPDVQVPIDDGVRVEADAAFVNERIAETLHALKGAGPEAIKPSEEGLGAVLANRAATDLPDVFRPASTSVLSEPLRSSNRTS